MYVVPLTPATAAILPLSRAATPASAISVKSHPETICINNGRSRMGINLFLIFIILPPHKVSRPVPLLIDAKEECSGLYPASAVSPVKYELLLPYSSFRFYLNLISNLSWRLGYLRQLDSEPFDIRGLYCHVIGKACKAIDI